MVNAVGAERNSADRGIGVGARHGDVHVAAVHPCGESAEGDLDGGAVVGVGHQAVGQPVCPAVGRPGAGHPDVGQARPAEVFEQSQRAGPQHFQRDHRRAPRDRPELDPHARLQQRGLRPVDIPQHRIGAPDQLPATGRLARVDAAELAGQPDRSGRHRGARVAAPRHRKRGITADQVGETRCESAESDPPRRGGVGLDRPRRRPCRCARRRRRGRRRRRPRRSPRRRGVGRRGASVSRRRCAAAEPLPGGCLVLRIGEFHQDGAGGRHDVEHAGQLAPRAGPRPAPAPGRSTRIPAAGPGRRSHGLCWTP